MEMKNGVQTNFSCCEFVSTVALATTVGLDDSASSPRRGSAKTISTTTEVSFYPLYKINLCRQHFPVIFVWVFMLSGEGKQYKLGKCSFTSMFFLPGGIEICCGSKKYPEHESGRNMKLFPSLLRQ